ncbi:MAG: hypothetical protein QXF70_03430 [Candidatus Bilamarchaeaceae archaeon]
MEAIAKLEAYKREQIPEATIEIWYKTLKALGYTKAKLDMAVGKIAMSKQYGVIKFDDFILTENISVELEVQKRINDKIKKGKELLSPKVTKEDKEAIDLYIIETMKREAKRLYEEELQKYKEKRELDAKRYYDNIKHQILNLDKEQKLKLLKQSELFSEKLSKTELFVLINTLHNFAPYFTNEMLIEVLDENKIRNM